MRKYILWYIAGIGNTQGKLVKRTKQATPDVLDLLAGNLKRLREEHYWSQKQMAQKIGKFQDYVSRLEAGKVNLTAKTLQAYVDALEIQPSELLAPLAKGSSDAK